MARELSVQQIFDRYKTLPEFIDMELTDVNQTGHFGSSPLHVACVRGDLEEVLPLLTAGADMNLRGELGYTPLHDAAAQGHIEVVKVLLQRGAIPKIKNDEGETPRDRAESKGFFDIVALFDTVPNDDHCST
ncbi:ankyrin repeat domain-containing protein [Candidatus Nitrospira nitrosa]|nr:ankyrin repeat domain-containing protein [Candidatus Nitrospira nitrosa]